LRVEQTHCLGSHTFFIARILHRHVYQNAAEFHRIHGIYAVYRRKSVVGRVPNCPQKEPATS
jgi:flavin reductase (DIM6/NTAB) family NADH-FMN oxidoreductase RutF